jgi:hypothetical protein
MNREEALMLLRGGEVGIAEWNRRRADGKKIPELQDMDLSEARLRLEFRTSSYSR